MLGFLRIRTALEGDRMVTAPIVLFVYNRPDHTRQTIEALQKNELADKSILYVFSDAAKGSKDIKSVDEVRCYVKHVSVFKKTVIIERKKNFGLANSVIEGVSRVIKEYGKVIVLEDDLVTSPYFLKYMNGALDFYHNNESIYSITGFNFSSDFMGFSKDFFDDVYLNIRPMSWSWATWEREWQGIDWNVSDINEFLSSKTRVAEFNQGGTDLTQMLKLQMNGKLDSWYIRWSYNAYLKKKHTIYPTKSLVNNIGHDSTGVHCGTDDKNIYSHTELSNNQNVQFVRNISIRNDVVSSFNKAFNLSFKSKVKAFVKTLFHYD